LAALPPVKLAVPPFRVNAPSETFDVNVLPLTFVWPVTLPPVRFVRPLESSEANEPPVAFSDPAVVVAPIVPAEMFAVPDAPTFRLPRFWLDTSVPPVTLARPVTEPPERVVVLPVTVKVASVPPVTLKAEEAETLPAVPLEIVAEPPETVTLASVALAVNVPAETVVAPLTVAPVRFDVPLEDTEANVPPVAFKAPALVVVPIVPADTLAVPPTCTDRLVRLAALISVPEVTVAEVPEPAVIFVVPPLTVTLPPETVRLERLMAVVITPAEATLPLTDPPVRLTVPKWVIVSPARLAFEVNVPSVTVVRPLTVARPPVKLVIPADVIEPIVPLEIFAVATPPTFRLPRFWLETSVPPVTLARPVTEPPERVVVLPVTVSVASVPPVTLRAEDAETLPAVPLEIVAEPPETVTSASVALAVNVPPVTVVAPLTVAPVRLEVPLDETEAKVPPVAVSVPEVVVAPNEPPEAFKAPALVVVPTVPAEIFAVPEAPTFRLPRFWLDTSVPPVTLARPVTEPPERVVVLPVTVRVASVPPVTLRAEDAETLPAVPLEMDADPPDTVTSASVALAVNVPPVTVVAPLTVAPVRFDVPLDETEAKVPPVAVSVPEVVVAPNEPPEAFKAPALVVVPTVPAEIFAVPEAPTFRLPRFWLETSVPPVTLARPVTFPPTRLAVPLLTFNVVREADEINEPVLETLTDAPEPAVMLVVPAETATDPPDTVKLEMLWEVSSVPADETLPDGDAPSILTVPFDPTLTSARFV